MHWSWTRPTARKRHWCDFCGRIIFPGETYDRAGALGEGTATTHKNCRHCFLLVQQWYVENGNGEESDDVIIEWLEETYPSLFEAFYAEWRYPDGELLPLPFTGSPK